MFTTDTKDVLLTVLERERRNARLRVVFIGDEPEEEVLGWFLGNRAGTQAYGIVSEPTFEKRGKWMATKTAGRWDYYKTGGELISEKDGFRLMEHVGWDYASALQAATTIRAYTTERLSWDVLSALIPAKAGFGYAESIVFGKGRKSSLRLSEGIPDSQLLKTLGLMRYYLRQFARLRASEVEGMTDRAVSLETGVHVWHWQTKYKPSYARYTNDRIRMRQGYVEDAMKAVRGGATTGVLEVLALQW